MTVRLGNLEFENPVLAAPMAGGPTTPAMVIAATRAGAMGFLAGGYKTQEQLAMQIRDVRLATQTFGVNLFAPNPVPVDPQAFRDYAAAIQTEADHYGLDLGGTSPIEDDDNWLEKVDLLLADPVPVVSFTFGIPDHAVIDAFKKAGTLVVQTVTNAEEGRSAADAGVDALAVQGWGAGGHSGTLTPEQLPKQVTLIELVESIRESVSLPCVAAGGVTTSDEISGVLRAGATAVAVGTVLLRTFESGASSPYKEALAERRYAETLLTRAFSGRPARAIPNLFTDRYDRIAPSGYPAINHLTSPLRKAAAEAGDADRINLWAGTGHAQAREESATETLSRIGRGL
jgi:nitronate monooxygenase